MGVNPVFGTAATKSGLGKGGEEGRDKRERHRQRKKSSQQERGPHPDWQSAMVSGGEPVQDQRNKELVS